MILRFGPKNSSLDLLCWLELAALMFLSTDTLLCISLYYSMMYVKSCIPCNAESITRITSFRQLACVQSAACGSPLYKSYHGIFWLLTSSATDPHVHHSTYRWSPGCRNLGPFLKRDRKVKVSAPPRTDHCTGGRDHPPQWLCYPPII